MTVQSEGKTAPKYSREIWDGMVDRAGEVYMREIWPFRPSTYAELRISCPIGWSELGGFIERMLAAAENVPLAELREADAI